MRFLVFDADAGAAALAAAALLARYPAATLARAATLAEFVAALDAAPLDVVIASSRVTGCEGMRAFHVARTHQPGVPFILLTASDGRDALDPAGLAAAGVGAVVGRDDLASLGDAADAALQARPDPLSDATALEYLVAAVNALSLARDVPAIMAIVRRAARDLTGADGATFVLRDGDSCYYADEDAIGPLWKGKRFPIHECISGWSMMHCHPAVVPDIRFDSRIPLSAYEPTFVRSVVMVPIRALAPVGAIGTYWATPRHPAVREVRLLQALADTTAVAMENVRVYAELEARVRERTQALEAFAGAISHDLRAPVRHVKVLTSMLQSGESVGEIDPPRALARIAGAAKRMDDMIEALLEVSRTTQAELRGRPVDLAVIAADVADECQLHASRRVEFISPASLPAEGDPTLLRMALQNLLGNAWKFSAKAAAPRVEFGAEQTADGPVYFVRDNGAGFDPAHASRLFGVFQRLHGQDEFPGTGVGLACVQRIIEKHGGTITATGAPGQGARFSFTLPRPSRSRQ